MAQIDFLSIFFVTILSICIGFLWYSSIGFGNLWKKLMNFSKKDLQELKKKDMKKTYLLSFSTTFLLVFILDILISAFSIVTFSKGFLVGFVIWAGFILTTMINQTLWENKPIPLYIINIMYYFIIITIGSGILAIW